MSSLAALFRPIRLPSAPTPAPAAPDPEVLEAERRRRLAALAALGRSQTVATGPSGLAGPAPVTHKKLLGQ